MNDCPFRYQGQYEDSETGLYYNRFRYYSPDSGSYISQDPIGLAGGNPTLYGYVSDSNTEVDPLGLNNVKTGAGRTHVTYQGVKNGLPYTGYASAPSHLGLSPDEIIAYRYNGNFDDFGGDARPIGQFLTDTFGPTTNRVNLALPPKWNSMAGIKQWQIKPGTTIIKGKVRPQLSEGTQYVGGANQIFVLEPWKYGTLF